MKNIYTLISLAMLSLLFVGCEKDNDPNYEELLQGTWVNTMVNEQAVLTDETFTMEFKSDNTELYSSGFQLDDNNKSWLENSNYTYSISGSLITIDGTDMLGNTYHMVFNILSLNEDVLTYSIQTFMLNGELIANTNTYSCKKVNEVFSTEFTGIWYGRCTTVGSADSLFYYWECLDGGEYYYYYQDENGNWIKKLETGSHYFLYGQLMAGNYSYDILGGGTGLTFECWNFTIAGNYMVWTGLRENNITITYEMERVSSLPETLR